MQNSRQQTYSPRHDRKRETSAGQSTEQRLEGVQFTVRSVTPIGWGFVKGGRRTGFDHQTIT